MRGQSTKGEFAIKELEEIYMKAVAQIKTYE